MFFLWVKGHMMWLKRQDSFKQKFGTPNDDDDHPHKELGDN